MQKERTIGTTTLKTPYIGMGTWAIGGGTGCGAFAAVGKGNYAGGG